MPRLQLADGGERAGGGDERERAPGGIVASQPRRLARVDAEDERSGGLSGAVADAGSISGGEVLMGGEIAEPAREVVGGPS